MATTTSTPSKVQPLPYSETDKLGPLGAKASPLHNPPELRAMLIREFLAATLAARDAAGAVDKGAATAVHDARKALRRARAVVYILSRALPKSERRAVRTALQEARRALSTIRDHSVAPETLAMLALGDQDRATATKVLANAAEAMPAIAEIKQLLGESAARAAAQAEALEAALPQTLDLGVVLQGVRDVYSTARRARRASKHSTRWFHTWRRRSKELSYQLELIANHAGSRLQAIHSELSGVTDTLGPAVDLIMLREFVDTHGHQVPADALDHLTATIDAQLDDLMKIARKAARDSFAQRPKRFVKRLARSIKRDLTPSDDHGDAHDLA